MSRAVALTLFACSVLSLAAKHRELVYDDLDVYKLTWDDRRISELEISNIAALSPFQLWTSSEFIQLDLQPASILAASA